MEPDLNHFRLWISSELKVEYDKSHSADFNTRKSANLRIDQLRLALQMLDEFLRHQTPYQEFGRRQFSLGKS
jgi:hypothetical protein